MQSSASQVVEWKRQAESKCANSKMKVCSLLVSLLITACCDGFLVSQPDGSRQRVASSLTALVADESNTDNHITLENRIGIDHNHASCNERGDNHITRRGIFQVASITAGASLFGARSALAADQGSLDDLPPQAARSYLQYRMPLQMGADYYLWTFQEKIKDTNDWGEIGELFQTNSARGGGQPNRIERDFTNPMRILGLSMPEEYGDKLRESQFKFEKAMAGITKATAGVRRDLPVEIEKNAESSARAAWDDGRVALNEFFVTLNEATGLTEMKIIPPSGPNQNKEYGRSERKYLDLMKVTKLCQNRGGPTLSAAWGNLMVSGTVQDSCGIAGALDGYFYQ